MSTASEKLELQRIASGASTQIPVIEMPKLSDALAPFLPRATAALQRIDEENERWRKSIFFGFQRGGNILQVGAATTAAAAQAVITQTLIDQIVNLVINNPAVIAPRGPDIGILRVQLQETVANHAAVTIDGLNARSSLRAQVQKLAGVSLQPGTAGQVINVRRLGLEVYGPWTWTPLVPIFINDAGLSQTPPDTGWTQRVGYPMTPTTVFVNPFEPVLLQ